MMSRREESVGHRPVVCNEKQAFRIDIKTAHREQIFSALLVNQIHDRLPAAVLRRRDHTLGFI